MNLVLQDGILHADRDATWKVVLDFEHVSGEYWIVRVDSSVAPGNWDTKTAFAAEFRVGSDGVVGELGLAIEPAMGSGGRVCFRRL